MAEKKLKLSEATHIEEKQHTGAHPLAINIQGYRSVHIGEQIPGGGQHSSKGGKCPSKNGLIYFISVPSFKHLSRWQKWNLKYV